MGLEFEGQEHTFGAIEKASNRLANRLVANGLTVGDRVGGYLPNCPALVETHLAALKLGAVYTPINALYRAREVEHIVADSDPRIVVTTNELSAHLPSRVDRLVVDEAGAALGQESAERPVCPAQGESPAALVYTSGTTGAPKGAVLTHNNLAVNAMTLHTCWAMTPSDRALHLLPLGHLNGLANGLHTWLTTGFRMRLLKRFQKETILDDLLDFQPTFFFGVPAVYQRLMEAPPETARQIGQSTRLFVSGSAPLSADSFERFQEMYGHSILERYGMTETLGNISNPYMGERRAGTVGKPLPGVSIRLSEGDHGEILVKGPNVFAGYWRNEEATRAAFTDEGCFRTGDLAVRSSDGYYTLQGRRDDLILCGGYNIYPAEIERLLREQPGVQDAVVVGTPDPVRGETPVAFILPHDGSNVEARALEKTCRAALASYKVPRAFHAVDEIPRNALGKVQRSQLRGLAKESWASE